MQTTETIIAELVRVYETAISTLQSDIANFAADGTLPPASRRTDRAWCYPEIRVHYHGIETRPDYRRSFGRLSHPGTYATTITRPALFAAYLTEQIDLLAADYDIEVEVGPSRVTRDRPRLLDLAGQRLRGVLVHGDGAARYALRPAEPDARRRGGVHVVVGRGAAAQVLAQRHGVKARRAAVLQLFHHVVESSKVGLRKPDPAIYTLMCDALGVAPENAVFLDDLGINLKPAAAMGMRTIKVGDPTIALNELSDHLGLQF